MKIAAVKTLYLQTLTPIYCGSGETLDPLSYAPDGNVIRVIDVDRFFSNLTEEQVKSYESWLMPLVERRARDEITLERFIGNRIGAKPESFLSSSTAYQIGFTIRPDLNGFKLHLRDASHRPYLPGTEIKGAFRTAVLHSLLQRQANYQTYQKLLFSLKNNARRKYDEKLRYYGEELRTDEDDEKAALLKKGKFSGKLETALLRGLNENDAKYDSFRLLQVSDSDSLKPDVMRIELLQSLNTSPKTYTKTWAETIRLDQKFISKLVLYDPLHVAKNMGFDDLSEQFKVKNLLQACYEHSAAILKIESDYFRGNQRISSIVAQLQSMNEREKPLLRLGGGQGFLSVTTNLQVKQKDAVLYDDLIRRGSAAVPRRRWNTYPNNFPKTRRAVTDQYGNPLDLLGWVKLSVE